jgi:hypothetical protein
VADSGNLLMIILPPQLGAPICLVDKVGSLVPISNQIFPLMYGHGFLWAVVRVLLPAWWHIWNESKKLVQEFVEGRPTKGTKSTN